MAGEQRHVNDGGGVTQARIYVRVSTDEQAEHGYSLAAQMDSCRAFCRSQGWSVVGDYTDDGYSAKDTERPRLRQMLADLQPDDVVVVWRLDRLTRSVFDLLTMLRTWDMHGVAFRSVTEVFDTTTAAGRLFILLVAALAQWERENIGERVRLAQAKMVEQGRRHIGARKKFGYTVTAEGPKIQEDEAAVIRQIDEWYLSGIGMASIAERLNNGGYPRINDKPWYQRIVRVLLDDEQYAGGLVFGQYAVVLGKKTKVPSDRWRRVPDYWPVIRTVETQHAIRTLKASKGAYNKTGVPGRAAGSRYLLSGLLYCACGARMHGHDRRKQVGDKTYHHTTYVCSRRAFQRGCDKPGIAVAGLDERTLQHIIDKGITTVARSRAVAQTPRSASSARLDAIGTMLQRHYQAYLAGAISLDDYTRLKTQMEAERTSLAGATEEHSTAAQRAHEEAVFHRLTADAREILTSGDAKRTKAWLLTNVDRITVDGADVVVVYK